MHIKWLAIAVSSTEDHGITALATMYSELYKGSPESNRVRFYKWMAVPGFRDWYYGELVKNRERFTARLLDIGIDRASKSDKIFEIMSTILLDYKERADFTSNDKAFPVDPKEIYDRYKVKKRVTSSIDSGEGTGD